MLHPNFLAHVADGAVALWEKLNIFAARDMARRIADAENHMTASADWQKYKMEQAGQSAEEIRKEIRKTLPLSEKQIKEIFEEATLKSFENDAKVFEAAGIAPPPFNGEEGRKLLQALYEQTNGELYNFTRTTAEQSQRIYIAACDDAMMRVRSGLQSKEQAIEQAIEKAAAGGLYVEYPSGHRDTVEVAVRRAVTTGVNQASLRMCVDECDSVGTNFVIVSAHLGARVGDTPHANHAGWQGGIYRIKDREKGFWGMFEHLADTLKGRNYPLLSEATGYPDDPLGLGGYNCRHNMMPYFPGVSENHMKQYDEAENKEAYENSQKQRSMERRMRERRRTMEGMKAALKSEEASEELKEEIRKELKKHEEKYKKQKEQYDQFCKDRKLTPQMNRTYVAKPKREETEDEPVYIHPDKIEKYLLKPGTKHCKEFADVGYTSTDAKRLHNDIVKNYSNDKIEDRKEKEDGSETYRVRMELGVTKIRPFVTVWIVQKTGGRPRFVTAFRQPYKGGTE